jgi:small-conductance mechanosensitive channel
MHRFGLMLLLLLGFSVAAADIAPPDPARLKAEWWSYFEPAEPIEDELLRTRVAELDEGLDKLRIQLQDEQRTDQLPGIARLRELLASYPASRDQQAALRDALPAPAESYSLEEAFARHRALLGLRDEVSNQHDEINWRRDLLAAERRQHSRAKVAYLELAENDPGRVEAGVDLMASRLQIELDVLDLARRQATLAQLREQTTALETEIEAIAGRLVLIPDEATAWDRAREIALDEASSFKDDDGADTKTAPTDVQQARIDALRILERDLRVKKAELLAARAEILAELIRFAGSDAPSTEKLRDLVHEAKDTLEDLIPRRQYWKNAVARVRETLDKPADGTVTEEDKTRIGDGRKLIAAVQLGNAALDLESEQLAFTTILTEQRLRQGASVVERGWDETLKFAANSLDGAYSMFSASLFEINETPVTLFGLLRVVFFVTLAWLVSKVLRRGLARLAQRRANVSQSSLYALGRVFHYAILAIGILIGLSSIGIDFTKFALLASALGIGIGFGMQALIGNFVAGLIILFEKSLKVGDFVELQSGVTGEVKEINMRSTLVTTNDNVDILVPNSDFITKEVTNWTLREAHRRIRVPFGVAYGTDKDLVRKAGLEAAENVRWTLKEDKRRKPQVWFVNFGDSSLDFELVVWLVPEAVKRPGAVQASYLWEIESKLGEYGIEVPFPQRDLHLRSGFEAVQTRP